jgi:hypothetical protein
LEICWRIFEMLSALLWILFSVSEAYWGSTHVYGFSFLWESVFFPAHVCILFIASACEHWELLQKTVFFCSMFPLHFVTSS